jgi:hypothetical protein
MYAMCQGLAFAHVLGVSAFLLRCFREMEGIA